MFVFRFISSVFLISLFMSSILIQGPIAGPITHKVFTVLTVILSFLACVEYLRMLDKIEKPSFPILAGLTSGLILYSVLNHSYFFIVSVVIVFIILCWMRILFSKNNILVLEGVVNSVSAIFLIIVPLSAIGFLYMRGEGENYLGRKLLLYLVLVTKFGDIFAYCVGVSSNKLLKGNHKILPSISPKKSWEGTIGGMIGSVIVSIVLWHVLELNESQSTLVPLLLGVFLFIGGFLGDLAESSLKRICGVKDSGGVIPGIGGVMDLLDSLLINAPLFTIFCFLYFF